MGMKVLRYSRQATPKNLLLLKTSPYIPISTSNHILYGRRRGRRRPALVVWPSTL